MSRVKLIDACLMRFGGRSPNHVKNTAGDAKRRGQSPQERPSAISSKMNKKGLRRKILNYDTALVGLSNDVEQIAYGGSAQ